MQLKLNLSAWLIALAALCDQCSSSVQAVEVGEAVPALTMTSLSGQQYSLEQLKGNKPVYLKFWASWCHYCLKEMAHLQSSYDKYSDGVEIISVNIGLDDSVANIQSLYQEKGYNLPTVFDQQGQLTQAFNVQGTPFHILIDASGKVLARSFLMNDRLDQAIALLAKQHTLIKLANQSAKGE